MLMTTGNSSEPIYSSSVGGTGLPVDMVIPIVIPAILVLVGIGIIVVRICAGARQRLPSWANLSQRLEQQAILGLVSVVGPQEAAM